MTEAQDALLTQLAAVLGEDPRIRSLWLTGSLGRGDGDAWSDVDLVAEIDEADRKACMADYKARRPDMPELVHMIEVYGVILAATTADWMRFDISFLTSEQLARMDGAAFKQLKGDPARTPPPHPPTADTRAAERQEPRVREFLRVLGLLPVAVGRQEWVVSQQGFGLLRDMLVDLMVDENMGALGARGGVKRLNPFLTAEQRATLEALPAPPAQPDALIAANIEIAQLFLARARPLAHRLAAPWPQAFEDATRAHLKATLGIAI
jgi:hypothetical protein